MVQPGVDKAFDPLRHVIEVLPRMAAGSHAKVQLMGDAERVQFLMKAIIAAEPRTSSASMQKKRCGG